MVAADSRVEEPEEGMTGYAAGYMDAMHNLCINCHEEKVAEEPEKYSPNLSTCTNCHRDGDDSQLREMAPYVTKETVAGVTTQEEGSG